MKKRKSMKNIGKCKKWRILACIGILSMLFACADHMLQDDVSPTAKRSRNRNKELTASIAKEWFESNYTPVVMTRTSNEEGKELTVKPCWDKAKESNRGRFEVVETPTLSRGMHVILDEETAQHWQPGMKADYIRNTTKMVVLKDMVTNKTRSFIMIFVGSYDYLMHTRNMGRNSYLYREPDYDGLVFYYAINGTFINGWRYSNGKLVGYISSSNKEQQAESFTLTRGHEECRDVYTTEYRQDCHDEYELVGGDMETGLIYDIVRYCDYIPYTTSYQDCHYVEDSSEDNNNNDGWWNGPYPPGGAGNENIPNTPPSETSLRNTLLQIKPILNKLGINIDSYIIQLNENVCATNARTLPTGVIEVCQMFFDYNITDRASIIWHEIYHINHHDITSEICTIGINITLSPDESAMKNLETFYKWRYGDLNDYYFQELINQEVNISLLRDKMWYKNEIETYTAELNNGISKSTHYTAELQWMLWKYQELYKKVSK